MVEFVEKLEAQLRGLSIPQLNRSVGEIDALLKVHFIDGHLKLSMRSPCPGATQTDLEAEVIRAAEAYPEVSSAEVVWEPGVLGRTIAPEDPVPDARNVILVMSGKGGVGKSTVASNLALALKRMGADVGLLDADIYGPSVPTMFGVSGPPMSNGKKIQPIERFGLKLMSIGFLLEDSRSAVIWRGPMLHGALMQFLSDVDWGPLDYLVLDMPPGTGDIALTLSQRLRSNGAVVVTTPQEVALQDVYKAVAMNKKVGIPIIGVVENESYFICDGCSKRHELFGSGGGAKVAEMAGAPLLGQIPLDATIRQWGDAGTPVVEASPGSDAGQEFLLVAERVAALIARQNAESTATLTIDRSGGVNRHLPIAR